MNKLEEIINFRDKIRNVSYQLGTLKLSPITNEPEINKLNKKLFRYRLKCSELKSKEVKI